MYAHKGNIQVIQKTNHYTQAAVLLHFIHLMAFFPGHAKVYEPIELSFKAVNEVGVLDGRNMLKCNSDFSLAAILTQG